MRRLLRTAAGRVFRTLVTVPMWWLARRTQRDWPIKAVIFLHRHAFWGIR